MNRRVAHAACAAALLLAGRFAFAQDQAPANPGGPCRDTPCRVIFDWGSIGTPASLGVDRRYGDASNLEPTLKKEMVAAGLRLAEPPTELMRLTVRPKMINAMCDVMPGTSTDMSCKTVEELTIDFASPDPAVKPPGTMRIRNRCGSGDTKLDIAQMAKFAAATLAYNLATDKKGMQRPVARC